MSTALTEPLPTSLAGVAIRPDDARYGHVASTYLRGGAPALVLAPTSVDQVRDAVRYAADQPVQLSVRSGGHGISGRSTNHGGIVIDVSALNRIEVIDPGAGAVRLQPGARWGEVAQALAPHGLAISSGDYGGVGVGGLATAGGIGYLGRAHGLTIDHVRGVDLVTADGALVRADTTTNPDLFWGVLGAGANFGIVTSFDMVADRVGLVGDGQLYLDASGTADFLQRFGAAAEGAPRDTTAFLTMGRPSGGQHPAMVRVVVDSDDPDLVTNRLRPFLRVAPVLARSVRLRDYPDLIGVPPRHGGAPGTHETAMRSALIGTITPKVATAMADLLASGRAPFFQLRTVGGAIADVPVDATAYGHRDAIFSASAVGWPGREFDALWDALRAHAVGLYLSFETGDVADRLGDAFPPATLARLRALKARWDPAAVFRDNFNVATGVMGARELPRGRP